jgi:carbon monoxide dehydrogenase subunit G
MEMQGQRRLPVAQPLVWAALNDPEVLKACVPGCERFEVDAEGSYSVVTALKIGPVSARFNGKVRLSDVLPPDSYTLGFEGQGGVAGFGKGTSAVRLVTVDGGASELHYTVSASVGGKIAQLGQRLIDGVARSLADDFFKRFEAELLRRYPVAAAELSEPALASADQPADGVGPSVAESSTGGRAGAESPADGSAMPEADVRPTVDASSATAAPTPSTAGSLPSDPAQSERAPEGSGGVSPAMLWIAGGAVVALVVWLFAR